MKKHIISGLLMLSIILPVAVFAAQTDVDPNAPASNCVSLSNNLRYRSRDASTNGDVSTLQDFLQSQGYLNSEPTGYFGLLTVAAVKSFQTANGITGDGFVGAFTRAKINTVSCAGTTPSMTPATTQPTPTTNPNTSSSNPSSFPTFPTRQPAYLPGCSSTLGYSSTNGVACDGSTPPTSTVMIPNVSLTASPMTAQAGQSVRLSWSLSGSLADNVLTSKRCNATASPSTPDWSGSIAPMSGGYKDLTVSESRTYNLTCFDANNTEADASVTVNVASVSSTFPSGCSSVYGWSTTTGQACNGTSYTTPTLPTPTVNVVASPTTIQAGQYANIDWTSTNATSCLGPNDVRYSSGPSGSETVTPTTTTTYTVLCYDGTSINGSIPPSSSQSVMITVTPVATNTCSSSGYDTTTGLPCGCSSNLYFSSTTGMPCGASSPVLSLTANPTSINVGQSSSISLVATNADYCTLDATPVGSSNGQIIPWQPVTESGTGLNAHLNAYATVAPIQSTTYEATCWNSPQGGMNGPGDAQSVVVYVQPTTPNQTLPAGCYSTVGYSSTTGLACDGSTPIIPAPVSTCTTSGYDSTTGFVCGCSSVNGYSSTTGLACAVN